MDPKNRLATSLGLVAACLLALSPAAWSTPTTGTLELQIDTLPPLIVPGSGDGVSTASRVWLGPGADFATELRSPVTGMTPGGRVTFPAMPIVQLSLLGRNLPRS